MRSAEKAKLDRRPCLTGGAKRLSICYSGRGADGEEFFAGEKSPFTNPCKSPLFCMRKVNISLFLMENLQDWGLMGEIYIGCGFIRGKLAGIYYDILGRVCDRLAGGGAFCKALGARLPGGGIVCSRLSASRSHRKVTVCTPRRRGVPFTRVKGTKTRLGLCPKTP